MDKRLINLTPHDIHIHTGIDHPDAVKVVTVPKSELDVRVIEDFESFGGFGVRAPGSDGVLQLTTIPRAYALRGAVDLMPDPQEDTIFIVSGMVLDHPALAGREDVAAPGPAVRDEKGRIIGCKGLRFRKPGT